MTDPVASAGDRQPAGAGPTLPGPAWDPEAEGPRAPRPILRTRPRSRTPGKTLVGRDPGREEAGPHSGRLRGREDGRVAAADGGAGAAEPAPRVR